MVLDTTILIYLAQPGGETLQAQIAATSPDLTHTKTEITSFANCEQAAKFAPVRSFKP